MRLLAISGSLRSASLNTAFCRAFARLAPRDMQVTVSLDLAQLPLFNPDLESSPPASVARFRQAVAGAHGLLIASPEYAHGVSGALKNALDWLVSFEGVVGKPVALINTSPRAHHAYDSLSEILRTMSMEIVPLASVGIPLQGYFQTEDDLCASPEVRAAIGRIFAALDPQGKP